MDRRSFICATMLASAQGALARTNRRLKAKKATSQPQNGSARQIQMATDAALTMQRRDWEQGILAQALLEAGDSERVILLTRAAIVQQTSDGRMGVVGDGGPTDPAMGGAAYAQAAEWTGDETIRRAVNAMLQWIRSAAPRSADGTLYHVFNAPEMWSDGFNGAPPFLAAMGFYDEALAQIEGFRKRLWNADAQLLAHIWDDGKQEYKDGYYWGGGNGWAVAGLARVIRSLPPQRHKDREGLAAFAREIIDGCLKHQRPDGLFHDILNQPASFVETNVAQMLAYAIYLGIESEWLPSDYRAHADRMRDSARSKMDSCGFVQGVCGAPGFNRPGTSTEGQAFCILMEAAGARLDGVHRS